MAAYALIVLVIVFFLTSVVGVVTGSNSLIAVPVMFQFGIDPKVAVATNMFGLVFMAVGGTIPFVRQGKIDYRKVSPFIVLTLISSAIGALLEVSVLRHEEVAEPRRFDSAQAAFMIMGGTGLFACAASAAAFRIAATDHSQLGDLTLVATALAVIGGVCVIASAVNLYPRLFPKKGD